MPKMNLSGRLNTVFIVVQKVGSWQQKIEKLSLNAIEAFSEQGEEICDLSLKDKSIQKQLEREPVGCKKRGDAGCVFLIICAGTQHDTFTST